MTGVSYRKNLPHSKHVLFCGFACIFGRNSVRSFKIKKKYGVSANSVAEPKKIGLGVFDDSEESERKKNKKKIIVQKEKKLSSVRRTPLKGKQRNLGINI
jgi:hypothetical protein